MKNFGQGTSVSRWQSMALLLTLIFVCNSPIPLLGQSRAQLHARFVRTADSLFALKKFDQAEFAFHQALVFNDTSRYVLKRLGEVAYELEEWKKFRDWFHQILEIDPSNQEAIAYLKNNPKVRRYFSAGDSLRKAQAFKAAEEVYKKALEIDPASKTALMGLGLIGYESRNWGLTKKWFKKILEGDIQDADANYYLTHSPDPKVRELAAEAERLRVQKKYQQAETRFRQALGIYQGAFEAFRGLGRIKFAENDWGEVKEWYKKVLDAQPQDLEAKYCLGVAYREDGKNRNTLEKLLQFRQSTKYLNAVIAADSTYRDVLYQRALLERRKKHYFEAIKWVVRQIDCKPELDRPHLEFFNFTRSFLRNVQPDSSITFLRNSAGNWAMFIWGELHRRHQRFALADSVFQNMLQQKSFINKTRILLSLVKLHVQQQNDSLANVFYQRALNSIHINLDAEFLFEDIKYLLTDAELQHFRNRQRVQDKKHFFKIFWLVRDPTPASNINYRMLEHYRRLIYAEKYFWQDDVHFFMNKTEDAGYLKFPEAYYLNDEFNDKGLIYIRHGAPDKIAATSGKNLPFNESWLYEARTDRPRLIFHFIVPESGARNNWRLTPAPPLYPDILADRLGWDSRLDVLYTEVTRKQFDQTGEDIMSRLAGMDVNVQGPLYEIGDQSKQTVQLAMSTDTHTWDQQQKIDIPFMAANFRAAHNQTRKDLYLAIPWDAFKSTDGNRACELEFGAVVYDSLLKEKAKFNTKSTFDSSQVIKKYVFLQHSFELEPMTHGLSCYVKGLSTPKIGAVNQRSATPRFEAERLALSDLVPAYLSPNGQGFSKFKQGDFAIVPNPTRRYKLTEPIFLYYEIYNLKKDAEQATDFEIEVQLQESDSQKKGGFLGLFGGGKKKAVAIKERRQGKDATAYEQISFDVSKLKAGEYDLIVKVKDRNAGQIAEKSILINLEKK
ncbi:MAG: tetratricopeptide repeat protein [bacterium]